MEPFLQIHNGVVRQDIKQVWANLEEEMQELKDEVEGYLGGSDASIAKELVDVVWCAYSMLKKMKYDPLQLLKLLGCNNSRKYFDTAEEAEAAIREYYPHIGLRAQQFGYTDKWVIVNAGGKICKPPGFEKLTAAEIEACKY